MTKTLIIDGNNLMKIGFHGFIAGKDTNEEKSNIEKYKKEYAEYWKEIIGVDGDFILKEERIEE
jgi:hypothetical protein